MNLVMRYSPWAATKARAFPRHFSTDPEICSLISTACFAQVGSGEFSDESIASRFTYLYRDII